LRSSSYGIRVEAAEALTVLGPKLYVASSDPDGAPFPFPKLLGKRVTIPDYKLRVLHAPVDDEE
jgi:hypothetical protein